MEKENIEDLEKKARKKSKEIYKGEHGNKNPNVRICGDIQLPDSVEVNCDECGKICYKDKKVNFGKIKHICIDCALKNHSNELTALELEVLERVKERK